MLQKMAFSDSVTGLANERMLAQQGVLLLANNSQVSLLYISLTNLDEVHSSHGQRVSNGILQQAAKRLEDNLKHNEHDVIARLGSSEFACLFADCNLEQAQSLADTVLNLLSGNYQEDDATFELNVALGVANFPKHAADLETLLTVADVAMHQARRQGVGIAISQVDTV
jgi:diguanylate cyclase (GGDEF)-like protein